MSKLATTIIKTNLMYAAEIDNNKFIAWGRLWIGTAMTDRVAQLDAQTKSFECSGLEEIAVPSLVRRVSNEL